MAKAGKVAKVAKSGRSKADDVAISFIISELKFVEFNSTMRLRELKKQIPFDGYEFRFDFNTMIREEIESFEITLVATLFEAQSELIKVELANMQNQVIFKIRNFNEVVLKEEDHFTFPEQFLLTTLSTAISSARGMFAMCVKDSIISNAIIPIINPRLLMPPQH